MFISLPEVPHCSSCSVSPPAGLTVTWSADCTTRSCCPCRTSCPTRSGRYAPTTAPWWGCTPSDGRYRTHRFQNKSLSALFSLKYSPTLHSGSCFNQNSFQTKWCQNTQWGQEVKLGQCFGSNIYIINLYNAKHVDCPDCPRSPHCLRCSHCPNCPECPHRPLCPHCPGCPHCHQCSHCPRCPNSPRCPCRLLRGCCSHTCRPTGPTCRPCWTTTLSPTPR